jgi:hypothetical protein
MRMPSVAICGALFAGCASSVTPSLPNPGAVAAGALAQPEAGQKIYVAEAGSYTGAALILEFPVTAKGNVAPSTVIVEPGSPGYNKATGVAVGHTGKIYAANGGVGGESDILTYGAHASGSQSPIADVDGSSTGLNGPWGLVADKPGGIYITNERDGQILYFAPGANGDVAPKRKISGSKTGLANPVSVVLNRGHAVVADPGAAKILAYPVTGNGNIAPSWTLGGSKTGIGYPSGVAFDSAGAMYVVEHRNNEILVFAKGAHGNVAPIRTIGGSKTQLYGPHTLGFDAKGEMFVLSSGICVFAKGAHGNVAPIRLISGSKTDLGVNTYLAVH